MGGNVMYDVYIYTIDQNLISTILTSFLPPNLKNPCIRLSQTLWGNEGTAASDEKDLNPSDATSRVTLPLPPNCHVFIFGRHTC